MFSCEKNNMEVETGMAMIRYHMHPVGKNLGIDESSLTFGADQDAPSRASAGSR